MSQRCRYETTAGGGAVNGSGYPARACLAAHRTQSIFFSSETRAAVDGPPSDSALGQRGGGEEDNGPGSTIGASGWSWASRTSRFWRVAAAARSALLTRVVRFDWSEVSVLFLSTEAARRTTVRSVRSPAFFASRSRSIPRLQAPATSDSTDIATIGKRRRSVLPLILISDH